METLKNILESILNKDNKHNVGKNISSLYPLPKKFENDGRYTYMLWKCKDLVQQYADMFKGVKDFEYFDEFEGIILSYDKYHYIDVGLASYSMYVKNFPGIYQEEHDKNKAKDIIKNFLNMIYNDPTKLLPVIEHAIESAKILNRGGDMDIKKVEDFIQ